MAIYNVRHRLHDIAGPRPTGGWVDDQFEADDLITQGPFVIFRDENEYLVRMYSAEHMSRVYVVKS